MEQEQKNKKDYFLPIAVLIAGLLIAGAVIYSNGLKSVKKEAGLTPTPSVNAKELKILDSDKILGDKKAELTLFEFSDFQCPYCGRFATLSRADIVNNYVNNGKVKMIFRDFPLPFHEYAQKASEAAWCAAEQDKYWEMHDLLFAKQSEEATDALSVANLKKYATQLGLNSTNFNDCLDSGKYQTLISDNYKSGQDIGISGTPTVVIAKKLPLKIDANYVVSELQKNNYLIYFDGGVMIVGAQPFNTYQTEIDKLLK